MAFYRKSKEDKTVYKDPKYTQPIGSEKELCSLGGVPDWGPDASKTNIQTGGIDKTLVGTLPPEKSLPMGQLDGLTLLKLAMRDMSDKARKKGIMGGFEKVKGKFGEEGIDIEKGSGSLSGGIINFMNDYISKPIEREFETMSAILDSIDQKRRDNIDTARQNLNTIYNQATAGGLNWDKLDDKTKNEISALERIAGMPVGFFEALKNKNPKADIIGTKDKVDVDGNQYFQVVTRDPITGKIEVDDIYPKGAERTTLTPEQRMQAGALAVRVFGKRAGTKPENIRKVTDLLKNGYTIDKIEDMLRYAGQSEKMAGSVRDAAESVALKLSKEKVEFFLDSIDRSLESDDPDRVKTLLKKAVTDTLGTEEGRQVRGKERTVEFIDEIWNDLVKFERGGGDTNIFTGAIENIAKNLGLVKEPELRKIATKISIAMQQYRRSMTGVAFSEKETKEYYSIFPGIDKVSGFNSATIGALDEVFKGDLDFIYGYIMGEDAYEDIFKRGMLDISELLPLAEEKGVSSEELEEAFGEYSFDEIKKYLEGKKAIKEVPGEFIGPLQEHQRRGMRTDRHNNPTAFTTDIAKMALTEGVDYEVGDPFPNNPNLKTARLLGDPIKQTIKVIDKIGFHTGSGKQRWTHTAMSKSRWDAMSYTEKKSVIKKMYQKEGNKGVLNNYFV